MDTTGFFAVDRAFGVSSAILGLLSLFFFLLGYAYDGRQGAVREWFRKRWEAIQRSPWRQLPERAIRAAVYPARTTAQYVGSMASESSFAAWVVLVWGMVAWGVAGYLWNMKGAALMALCTLPALLLLMDRLGLTQLGIRRRLRRGPLGYQFLKSISLLGISLWLMVLYEIVRRLVSLPTATAAAIMPAALPLTWLLAFLFLSNIGIFRVSRKALREDWAAVAAFGVALSFSVSLVAMYIGHVAVPQAWVPKTFQMLAANAVCDGLTLVATLGVLIWAVGGRGVLRLPAAVFVDIGIAVVLALGSLHLGLAGTEKALSTRELLNVLFARSPDGSGWQLGPYFWVMHTAFLPTVGYLGLIMVCWLGKVVLIPVHWFFGVGHEHKNPLTLTGWLFAVLSGVLKVVQWM